MNLITSKRTWVNRTGKPKMMSSRPVSICICNIEITDGDVIAHRDRNHCNENHRLCAQTPVKLFNPLDSHRPHLKWITLTSWRCSCWNWSPISRSLRPIWISTLIPTSRSSSFSSGLPSSSSVFCVPSRTGSNSAGKCARNPAFPLG